MDECTMGINNVTLVGGKIERGDDVSLEKCYEDVDNISKFDGAKQNFMYLENCEGTCISLFSLIRVLFDKMDKILAKLEEKE